MLDFVFAVDDPVTWHTMNLLQNRKHYSILKLLGPTIISSIQSNYGASVYYNTLVPVDGRVNIIIKQQRCAAALSAWSVNASPKFSYETNTSPLDQVIKYGVISTDALIDDLLHWKTMYVAGRLHKPVSILSHALENFNRLQI